MSQLFTSGGQNIQLQHPYMTTEKKHTFDHMDLCWKSNVSAFIFLIYFLLKDNCFTEFCYFLSNLNMNQPQVYIYPLPFGTQKTKIMASGPITSWQIDGKTMETVRDVIFLGYKITADGDFSHEIKRLLLLGRKTMINLDSILKSRDITFTTKVHLVKVMVFLVVMCGCELDHKEG